MLKILHFISTSSINSQYDSLTGSKRKRKQNRDDTMADYYWRFHVSDLT